jgi:hypothetical protein
MSEHSGDEEISLCPHCNCMTHTLKGLCGKCWKVKPQTNVNKTPDSVDVDAGDVKLSPSDEALRELFTDLINDHIDASYEILDTIGNPVINLEETVDQIMQLIEADKQAYASGRQRLQRL